MFQVLFALSLAMFGFAARAAVPDTPPRGTGEPHVCEQLYPQAAADARAEGTTTLSFRITDQGAPSGIAVSKSSGNTDLDAASVQCVTAWRYQPATHDGKPVETPWQANVVWKMQPLSTLTAPAAANAHVCRNYPHGSLWNDSTGKVTVGFRVVADGTVADPAITQSSGDPGLDAAALACAMHWRYKPATRDGVAIDYPWSASVAFATHPGNLPPPSPQCARYAGVTADMLVGIAGVTRISLRIMPDGSTSGLEILRASGSDALDQAALKCMGDKHFDVVRAKIPPAGVAQTVTIDWHADVPKQ